MITPIKQWFTDKKNIPAKKHGISRQSIPYHVLQTVEKLQKADYQAYIVGGGVRDILLGFSPKDFDIATDATPEQVRQLFRRRSRVIGRRFRIVHVYTYDSSNQRDILEVSTFRSDLTSDGKANNPLIKNDCYGSAQDDANRRDFTINGIFYDPCAGNILDYVGGYADIRKQKIRMIGNPKKRLAEDPMRILRAIRLTTKLGLTVDAKLEKLLAVNAALITDIPYSRLFDELIKVLKSGASARILKQWQSYSIPQHIMPVLNNSNPFFFSVLAESDRRLAESRPTSISFVIAALFWNSTADHWHRCRSAGDSPHSAMEKAVGAATFSQNRIIPQRLAARAKDIFFLQALMEEPATKRRTRSVMNNEFFERALAFASIRQDANAAQTASWWSQYAKGDKQEQQRMLALLPTAKKSRKSGKSQKSRQAAVE